MFKRLFQPPLSRSFFLFGPRSVGKSTLLQEILPERKALWFDLLDPDLEKSFSQSPAKLKAILDQKASQSKKPTWVVIDEIQKVPALLNEVHRLIEEKKIRFLLTGSSARKLKGDSVNLLAGRAWRAEHAT